ncbi:EH domain-containing protein 2-like [Notothenia coriiceps]|uniref:EH domain-containing protein 2-like n=1 Tax=Notothenia coriiceps TaxID=8208 RepID=A0A6I9NYQ8_9TELE|nr:PREDICTED: EH domain-containing protein 2-like [Notothenia coriiceps]
MPTIFCKESKKHNLIYQLPVIFTKIQQQHRVPAGDFPDCTKMQEKLLGQDFSKFKTLKPSLMASLDKLLATDIANLVPLLQQQELRKERKKSLPGVLDGEFLGTFRRELYKKDPFKEFRRDDESGEADFVEWAVEKYKPKYDEIFYNLSPNDGKLSGTKVREWMTTTLLPSSVLAHIWRLSDVDGDGMLDNEEFALAVHLIEGKLEGHWLPRELPSHLVPPSKRLSTSSDEEQT